MVSEKMGTGRNDLSSSSGESRMVFLQRGNNKEQVQSNDKTGNERGSDATFPGWSKSTGISGLAKVFLSGLTDGETLLIIRKRENLSQEAVAEGFGITRNQYGRIERDIDKPRFSMPVVTKLNPHEVCFLARRRMELTQEECAEAMGVTRFWYNQMEMNNVPNESLIKFWEN